MKKNLLKGILLFSMIALVLTGCETEKKSQYIKLKRANYAFKSEGNAAITVDVDANVSWKPESKAAWVKVSDVTATSFVLTVDDYEGDMERDTKVIITGAGLTKEIEIRQSMADSGTSRYRLLNDFTYIAQFSPNGRYAGGYSTDVNEETDGFEYLAVIIDLLTDERHEFGPYPQALHDFDETVAISDEGVLYVLISGGSLSIDLEGNTKVFLPPFDWSFKPSIAHVAEDGTLVGYATKDAIYRPLEYSPEGIPTALDLPELGYRNEPISAGGMARAISANGKVIVGTMWEDQDSGLIWWNEDREVAYVGNRTFTEVEFPDGLGHPYKFNVVTNGVEGSVNNAAVSPSGKYICGMATTETVTGEYIEKAFYPCFFNTETGEVIKFEEVGQGAAMGATDDGIGFIGLGFPTFGGTVVDIENGTVIGTPYEWVAGRYGLNITRGYILNMTKGNEILFGNIQAVSDGGVPDTTSWYVGPSLH